MGCRGTKPWKKKTCLGKYLPFKSRVWVGLEGGGGFRGEKNGVVKIEASAQGRGNDPTEGEERQRGKNGGGKGNVGGGSVGDELGSAGVLTTEEEKKMGSVKECAEAN